jgi:ABC-type nitrate/sulfonate/bicarbonate transport system substrate-binding protein
MKWSGIAVLATMLAVVLAAVALREVPGWSSARDAAPGAAPRPAPARVVMELDGRFSAPFAGEMLAARRQQAGQPSGVILELREVPDRADFVAQVVRDNVIGVASAHKVLLSRWQGTPAVAFAASFLDSPTVVFAPERSGIRAPQDLIGKTLGYQPGSEDAVVFDAMMAQLGLPRSQLDKVAVADGFPGLQTGSFAALVSSIGRRPAPSGPDAPRLNVIRPLDYGIHVPGLVYFTSEALLRDRPSLVRDALREIIAGWHQVYADIPAAAAVVAAYDPGRLSVAEVDFALREQRDLVRPVGMRVADFDQSRWNTLRDILLYAKLGSETVSLSRAVTYDVLRDVYREMPGSRDGNAARPAGVD